MFIGNCISWGTKVLGELFTNKDGMLSTKEDSEMYIGSQLLRVMFLLVKGLLVKGR